MSAEGKFLKVLRKAGVSPYKAGYIAFALYNGISDGPVKSEDPRINGRFRLPTMQYAPDMVDARLAEFVSDNGPDNHGSPAHLLISEKGRKYHARLEAKGYFSEAH